MNKYYRAAIMETLNTLSESKLCFIYTLMMNMGWCNADTKSEEHADAV